MAWSLDSGLQKISRYAIFNGFKPLEQEISEMALAYILKTCNFDGYGPSTDPTSETPPGARSARLHGRCRVAEAPGHRPQVDPRLRTTGLAGKSGAWRLSPSGGGAGAFGNGRLAAPSALHPVEIGRAHV